jgi:hypothetical protein
MATHIRDVMKGLLRHAKDQHHIQQQLEAVLDQLIDEQTRKYISVKYIQKKTLVLSAGSSAALYNANLKKTELLQAVKQLMPEIENITIKV